MTIKTELVDRSSSSIRSAPIRVHAGPSKRGRKLSDYKRSLLAAAVQEVRDRRRNGDLVSVREIAEFHGVAKSTLHRYLRPDEREHTPPPRTPVKLNKLAIDFLIDRTNTTVIDNNCKHFDSLESSPTQVKHTSPFIASPTDVKSEFVHQRPYNVPAITHLHRNN